MRWRFFVSSTLIAACCAVWPVPTAGVGRPGITPVACPAQTWQPTDPAFDPLPGAKAYFGQYDGGVYRIEIPDRWNGELMLSAHGFTTNAGPRGSELRVSSPLIREHLIQEGFAWAASSYRCNGYVPGIGLQDTMALTDLFTKFNAGRAPERVYLTGGSMGGHVTLLGMHEFPTSFAGGLAMCPAGPELFDYFSAVGAAAEVITGVPFDQPSTVSDSVKKMTAILGTPPDYTPKGLQLASVEIQLSGGPRPFALERDDADVVALAPGQVLRRVLEGVANRGDHRVAVVADALGRPQAGTARGEQRGADEARPGAARAGREHVLGGQGHDVPTLLAPERSGPGQGPRRQRPHEDSPLSAARTTGGVRVVPDHELYRRCQPRGGRKTAWPCDL